MFVKLKSTFLLTLLTLTCFSMGCEEGIGSFSVNEKSDEVVVQGGGTIIDLPINIFPQMALNINLQQELDAANAGAASGVFLKELELKVTEKSRENNDDVDNFDFVQSVTVYVESTKANSTLKKVKIAEVPSVPKGLQVLPLTVVENINLKPYIEEGMRLKSEGKASVPEDDVSLLADVTVRIDVL